jgi:hypothetical protein
MFVLSVEDNWFDHVISQKAKLRNFNVVFDPAPLSRHQKLERTKAG